MRASRVAVFAFVLVCAFAIGGFVDLASAAAPKVKVIVTPSDPAVILGGTQQFKAKVTGVKGAAVVWSLDSKSISNGCTIDSTTGLLTVPATITKADLFEEPVVTATYTGTTPSVSGTATFTITNPLSALFMGTLNCTKGSCNGEAYNLAMNVKNVGGPTIVTLDSLVLNGTLTGYETFQEDYIRDTIPKPNDVQGKYTNSAGTFWLLGEIDYNGGTVDKITGNLYFDSDKTDSIGNWEVDLTSTGLAKTGSFTITDKSLFGVAVNGTLAGVALPADPGTFEGVLEVPQHRIVAPATGSYEESSGTISFHITITGRGTFYGSGIMSSNGNASGDITLNSLTGQKVGTWSLHDL